MRISSGLSGALQENMYDGITVLGTISEGRFFRVLKARMGTKYIILKSAGLRAQKVPAVTESSHNALKDRLRTEMSVFYSILPAVCCAGFYSTLPAGSAGTLAQEISYNLLLNLFLTSPQCIFDRL